MIKSCKTCANREYDGRWGGPMCTVYKHSVRDVDKYLDCELYKKKEKKKEEKE